MKNTLLMGLMTAVALGAVPEDDLERIRQAVPTEAPAKPFQARQLLVFTLAKGYIHEATPWGVEALRAIGEKTGAFAVAASQDPEVFQRDSLTRFDAVCFLNTCYTPFTNSLLKSNLLDFIRGGKGYVGIHCSAHTFLDWPEFGLMQGAYSTNHPWIEQVVARVEEPEHPLMKCFGGNSFTVTDEIYQFGAPYSRRNLRVLMSLDTSRTDMKKPDILRTDDDFGLVWVRPYGQGRVFYSAFGHQKAIFWNPTILRHYLAGIQFALGDLPAEAQVASETKPLPRFDRVPGVVIDHSPASSGLYIGSPSLAVLPNGDYVASHDFFGPKSDEFKSARSVVFRSQDRGQSWTKVSEIQGAFWSSLFVHHGALYLLGPDRHHGNILIRRSKDGGETWTTPSSATTGLLRDNGEYHCAPMPVLEHRGRLWRAFERRDPPVAWGINYRSGMLSAPVDAELLNAANWTASNFVPSDRAWNNGDMGAWLEGNAVVAPSGALVNVLRVQTRFPDEKAAIINISPDGKTASFEPTTGFVNFPGGAKKFAIRFDPQSQRYWSIASIVHERHRAPNPGGIRNTLALTCSPDLTNWTVRCLLLYHPDVVKHGFQYVDWLFDGDDIIAACRTAYDDGLGGAHNNHDANILTFHRFTNFRTRTMVDSVPLPETAHQP